VKLKFAPDFSRALSSEFDRAIFRRLPLKLSSFFFFLFFFLQRVKRGAYEDCGGDAAPIIQSRG
jgi:hypothetical protein